MWRNTVGTRARAPPFSLDELDRPGRTGRTGPTGPDRPGRTDRPPPRLHGSGRTGRTGPTGPDRPAATAPARIGPDRSVGAPAPLRPGRVGPPGRDRQRQDRTTSANAMSTCSWAHVYILQELRNRATGRLVQICEFG